MYPLLSEQLVRAVQLEREHEARHHRHVVKHREPKRLLRWPVWQTRRTVRVGVATVAAS